MKAHTFRKPTMNEQEALNLGNLWLWTMNVVLGLMTLDVLNLIVAVMGFLAMAAANAVKVVVAYKELRELARNKWKKPPPPTEDNDTKA